MAKERVLVVDDDVELCELLTEYLGREGFEVEAVLDGDAGVARATAREHAIVILDVMLPGCSGFEVLRRIRARVDTPVVMLTARSEDVDRIVGLEIGADDYLAKPFNPRELVARIRAVLRRASASGSSNGAGPPPRLIVGDVDMDIGGRTVRCAGRGVELTAVEFALLKLLLRSAGRVVARDDLSRRVLGRVLTPFDRSIDMHVSNLRKKLGHRVGPVERIRTVRGVGYVYANPSPPVDASP